MIPLASFLLFFDFGDISSRTINEILNFGHLPLTGTIAICILWFLNRETQATQEVVLYIKTGTITILLGILSEFIQLFTPYRDFEIKDMLADSLGAIAFLGIAYSLGKDIPVRRKRVIRAVSIVLIVSELCPILPAAIDDWHMHQDFPLLGSFESFLEMSRWTAEGTNKIERVKQYATDGDYALKAMLLTGMYPGVSMEYFIPDWSGYSSLEFDVFYEEIIPLKITVRINDRMHNEQFNDRYNENFLLQKGLNHISIRLDKIKNAPKGRMMDMTAIKGLCIFTYRLKEPKILYLDNIRLKK
jgi:hypothetical protein